MSSDPTVARLVAIMTSSVGGLQQPPHVAAYGWLSRAVKQVLDGEATLDDLEKDLSVCETAILQAGGK